MRSARTALLAALLLATAAAAAPDGAAARRPSDGDAATTSSPAPAPGASTKTIAQRIDEALENEFPREADPAVGKTYSEKAKADDVSWLCCVVVVKWVGERRDKVVAGADFVLCFAAPRAAPGTHAKKITRRHPLNPSL